MTHLQIKRDNRGKLHVALLSHLDLGLSSQYRGNYRAPMADKMLTELLHTLYTTYTRVSRIPV